jgi:hypothetical protein
VPARFQAAGPGAPLCPMAVMKREVEALTALLKALPMALLPLLGRGRGPRLPVTSSPAARYLFSIVTATWLLW